MTPKVSVVIPIYNVESYLRACIESALDQTLQEIEVILLDDGSTDGSPAIIDYYAERDARVVAVHKPNEGYGTTCNRGMDMARGEFVAILESDDFIHPSMYEELYRCAIDLGADVVKSPYFDCFADGVMKAYPYHRWISDNMPNRRLYSLRECSAQLAVHQSIWAGIYKRSYLEKNTIRFDEVPGAGHVDIKFCVQSLVYSDHLAWLDTPYYYYRVLREDSSTATFSVSENAQRYRQMHDFFKRFPDVFAQAQKYLVAREGVGLYRYYKKADFSHDDFQILQSLLMDFDDESIAKAPLITKDEKEELLSCRRDPESAYGFLRSASERSRGVFKPKSGLKKIARLLSEGSRYFDWSLKLFAFGVLAIMLLGYIADVFPASASAVAPICVALSICSLFFALAAILVLLLKVVKRVKRSLKGRA